MPCAKAACEKVPPSVEQGSEALSFEALGAGASRDLGSERGYVHHPSKPKHLPLPGTPVNKGVRQLHGRACLSDSDVPSEPLSNQTRTSTPHCATSGRPARVLGSRWEAVPVATGTLTDRLPPALLQGGSTRGLDRVGCSTELVC